MTKSPTTLEQLASRLREQTLEVAALRAAVDVQFKRIADMHAELDVLPQARQATRGTPRRPTALD